MSGALGLGAAWVGFCFLVLAVKGVSGTQAYANNQSLSVYGSVIAGMILKGDWPFGALALIQGGTGSGKVAPGPSGTGSSGTPSGSSGVRV